MQLALQAPCLCPKGCRCRSFRGCCSSREPAEPCSGQLSTLVSAFLLSCFMLPPLCRSVCPQTTWKGHLHPPSRVSHSSASGRGCRHHPGPTTSQIAQSGRGWRHLRVHLCHPCSGRDTWNKSPRATSRWGVKSSRGGGSTTSLISSVTHTVK